MLEGHCIYLKFGVDQDLFQPHSCCPRNWLMFSLSLNNGLRFNVLPIKVEPGKSISFKALSKPESPNLALGKEHGWKTVGTCIDNSCWWWDSWRWPPSPCWDRWAYETERRREGRGLFTFCCPFKKSSSYTVTLKASPVRVILKVSPVRINFKASPVRINFKASPVRNTNLQVTEIHSNIYKVNVIHNMA